MLQPRKDRYTEKKEPDKQDKKENKSKQKFTVLSSSEKKVQTNIKKLAEKIDGYKLMVAYGVFLILLGILGVLYINQSIHIVELNTQLNQMEQEYRQLAEVNHELDLKLSQKTSLARIEKKARERLNMEHPEQSVDLVLNSSSDNIDQNEEKRFFLADMAAKIWDNINVVRAESSKEIE